MNYEILKEYGIDYTKGLKRCMDDESFYQDYVASFLEDDSFARGKKAFERKDYQEMFCCIHELSGVCSNADLLQLHESVKELVELLRNHLGTPIQIEDSFYKMEKVYLRTIEGIKLAIQRKDI